MCRKVGAIWAFFFITISIINWVFTYPFYDFHVYGQLIIGLSFLFSCGNKTLHKILQLFVLFFVGGLFLAWNDVNSMVPIVVLMITVLLYNKYFPLYKKGVFIFPVIYIIEAILLGWSLIDIIASIIVHIALNTILFIIEHDKVY